MNRILILLFVGLFYPFLSKAQVPADTVVRMDQRVVTVAPSVANTYNQAGKIVVEIHVDRKGNVISARAGAKGTTVNDEKLLQECRDAALNAKFNAAGNVPEIQIGYLTFVFKPKAGNDSDETKANGKDKQYR